MLFYFLKLGFLFYFIFLFEEENMKLLPPSGEESLCHGGTWIIYNSAQ